MAAGITICTLSLRVTISTPANQEAHMVLRFATGNPREVANPSPNIGRKESDEGTLNWETRGPVCLSLSRSLAPF